MTSSASLTNFDSTPPQYQFKLVLEDSGFSDEGKTKLAFHAAEVFHHYAQVQDSTIKMCMGLKALKDVFFAEAAGAQYVKGEGYGWEKFCDVNFASLKLGSSRIRLAIRLAEQFIALRERDPEGLLAIDSLSRSAVFALASSTDEVVSEVVDMLKQQPSAKVTMREIQEMNSRQKTSEDEAQRLAQKNNELDLAVSDLNARLMDKENEVISLRDHVDDLQEKLKTPVESLVPTLPEGVKSEAEYLENIRKEASARQEELKKAEALLLEYRRKLADAKQVDEVLESLKSDLAQMTEKYSRALVKKISDQSAPVRQTILDIAVQMHALADQLSLSK